MHKKEIMTFDNESVLQSFRENDLDNLRFFFKHIRYVQETISPEVLLLLEKNLSINCYGSDGRKEKSNREQSSIDLLICNNEPDIDSKYIVGLIKDIVSKVEGVVEIEYTYELSNDGINLDIEENILEVGETLRRIQIDPIYIDVQHKGDKLYKFGENYFPDRLLDSQNIGGNEDVLEEFKLDMMDDIISKKGKKKISKKFYSGIKKYFEEEYIKGKNHKIEKKSYKLDYDIDNNKGFVRYDGNSHSGFKYGILRPLQYIVTKKFVELVENKGNRELVKQYPYTIKERLIFLKNESETFGMNLIEIDEIVSTYNYFKNFDEKLRISYKYGIDNEGIENTDEKGFFYIEGNKHIQKINRFIELLEKIK